MTSAGLSIFRSSGRKSHEPSAAIVALATVFRLRSASSGYPDALPRVRAKCDGSTRCSFASELQDSRHKDGRSSSLVAPHRCSISCIRAASPGPSTESKRVARSFAKADVNGIGLRNTIRLTRSWYRAAYFATNRAAPREPNEGHAPKPEMSQTTQLSPSFLRQKVISLHLQKPSNGAPEQASHHLPPALRR